MNSKICAFADNETFTAGKKKFTLSAGFNHRGSMITITEERGDYRNVVIVPGSAAQEFITAFARSMSELGSYVGPDDEKNWPLNAELPSNTPNETT